MKSKILTAIAVAGFLVASQQANAQVRQPAPTGQIPKAYTGVQPAPAATFRPKPTGQIAPEVPGQPIGTLPQPAQAVTPQKTQEVQSLGFENYSAPVQSDPSGMVPKVNTSQDPRVMTERFAPAGSQQQQTVTSEQVQQAIQHVQTQNAPATGNYAPATQTRTGQTTAPANNGQAVPQSGQTSTQTTAPSPQTYSAPRAAQQRVDPK